MYLLLLSPGSYLPHELISRFNLCNNSREEMYTHICKSMQKTNTTTFEIQHKNYPRLERNPVEHLKPYALLYLMLFRI